MSVSTKLGKISRVSIVLYSIAAILWLSLLPTIIYLYNDKHPYIASIANVMAWFPSVLVIMGLLYQIRCNTKPRL